MFPAALLQIFVVVAVCAVILWGLSQIPMDAALYKLIRVIVIVLVSIWLIYLLFGLLAGGPALSPPLRR